MNEQTGRRPRPYPPVYFFSSLLLVAGFHVFLPVWTFVPSPFRYAGLALLAAGLGLVLWSAYLYRWAGTTIRPFRESRTLVTRGPYRLSRNPIYLGMVVALLGAAVLAGSLSSFLIPPAFAVLMESRFIRGEEAMLDRTFGAAYAEYKSRVRRWL